MNVLIEISVGYGWRNIPILHPKAVESQTDRTKDGK